jgi:hypothetical protein
MVIQSRASRQELREALLSANIPTLLMVLAHVTGDHSWLEPPYVPTRTIALNDNDTAGFSGELQAAGSRGCPRDDQELAGRQDSRPACPDVAPDHGNAEHLDGRSRTSS